jgi:phosphinothricin acetyltransferase
MRVRPAEAGDAAAVAEIWNPIIRDTTITFAPDPRTPEAVAALVAERHEAGHAFLVALDRDRVAGFAFYGQLRGGKGYARTLEHTVQVAAACRGRGIGRLLMDALEDRAAAAGAHALFAGVSAENEAGRLFHEAIGYRHVATLPEAGWKFGRWIDLHLLRKPLG